MAKSNSTIKRQLSYKQLVQKIVKDRKFARSVHKLVCQSRDGNEEARKKLNALFKITEEDLEQCCLPASVLKILDCSPNNPQMFKTSPTSFMLLDFAAMV